MPRRHQSYRPYLEPLEDWIAPNNLWTPVAEVLPGLLDDPFTSSRPESPSLVTELSEPQSQLAVATMVVTGFTEVIQGDPQVFPAFVTQSDSLSATVMAWGVASNAGLEGQFSTGDTIERTGMQNGLIRIRELHQFFQVWPRGNFRGMSASTFHNGYPPGQEWDRHQRLHGQGGEDLTYATGAEFSTRIVYRELPGTRFASQAAAVARVQAVQQQPKIVEWTPNGSAAWVRVQLNLQTTGEQCSSQWVVRDPATFDTAPGEEFELTFTPDDSWNWHFPVVSPGYEYTGIVDLRGGFYTTYMGMGTLFEWSVLLNQFGEVQVGFTSHPALGLDDYGIRLDMQNRFSFDAATGNFTFDESNFALTGTLTVNASQVEFESELSAGIIAMTS